MEQTVAGLLSRWRACRSEAVADDLCRLSDAITPRWAGLAFDRWDSVFEQRQPELLGLLLQALPSLSSPHITARLDRLFGWPPDPRVTEELRRLLLQRLPPARDRATWWRVLGLVAWTGDTRVSRWLPELLTDVNGTAFELRVLLRRAEPVLAGLGVPVVDRSHRPVKIPERPVYTPAPPAQTPHALEIWADQLLERDDPRGELIILQSRPDSRPTQRRRARELVRLHGRAWLGPLSRALRPDGLVFEHGCVVAGILSGDRAVRELTGAAEWLTVRRLDLRALRWMGTPASALLAFLTHPAMKSLHTVSHLPTPAVEALGEWTRPMPLKRLELHGHYPRRVIDGLKRWPELEIAGPFRSY